MSMFKGGSGYTMNDLVYYSGLFLGIIVVFSIGRPYGLHPIVMLGVGLCAGVGLGYLMERAYRKSKGGGGGGGNQAPGGF
jgi:hypothetical protein